VPDWHKHGKISDKLSSELELLAAWICFRLEIFALPLS
jgi:hypothetical protein